ncbi:unnamed protein product [Phaedon cochleariae]|uniref:Uncharacterized protein n=1 Tax=Phaedon cochleariae TaxID=80249 RepID=A0A9N9SC85_PHACE|nr:unnamed protein product [Phaedon cochleariae]
MNPGQHQQSRRPRLNEELVIDGVLSTQPELGPIIPDGGYGWLVFLATLFFQAVVPSLVASFGIFLVFSKLPSLRKDIEPNLWDNKMLYTPLMFIASWTFFDPTTRILISHSTWPRLVATAGTCLTCAGLLILWMGMESDGSFMFVLAGLISGIGAAIQMPQCEILLGQYFRIKHNILVYISYGVMALGFIIVPIVIGHHILSTNLHNVLLWYQAIILQGLICNLTFRKPTYLKSKQTDQYKYITSNPDDEEDILFKSSRELQITRQNSTGTNITIEKHQLPSITEPSTSDPSSSGTKQNKPKDWETFDEDANEENEQNRYEVLKNEWETFEDDDVPEELKPREDGSKTREPKNLKLELSLADENEPKPRNNFNNLPIPLFTDSPVNNNNTYSYDIVEQDLNLPRPAVFMPTTINRPNISSSLELLQRPTFYKSLLSVMTTKFSIFMYYTLLPTFMYQEIKKIGLKEVASLMGLMSITTLLFSGVAYWINIDKKKRAICLWCLCWVGAFGYFMISDSNNTKQVFIYGAVQVTLSIATLQFVGMPLLGLTMRGESNMEFCLINMMTGISFIFFLIINCSIRNCFRLMGLLHFFTGMLWFVNYIYKKITK